jgi:hypothetical protein
MDESEIRRLLDQQRSLNSRRRHLVAQISAQRRELRQIDARLSDVAQQLWRSGVQQCPGEPTTATGVT